MRGATQEKGQCRDLIAKLQQVTDPTGTYGFAYDNMGRLVGTTTQYTFVTGTYTNAYTYDANSNRASMTDPQSGVTSYAYDPLNRLSTLTAPTAFGSVAGVDAREQFRTASQYGYPDSGKLHN